jgi:excinuclease UvrABC nuclease subunit
MSFEDLKNVTALLGSGVYVLVYKERVQYIGRTWCLLDRLGNHCSSPRKIPFDSVYVIVCSNAEEKEYELILKYKPKYNREIGGTPNKFKGKSPEMYKIDKRYAEVGKRHAEKEMAKLITEIEGKKEVDDIITVFKRRL